MAATTIRVYDDGNTFRTALNELEVEFTERKIFSGFWGTEFTVQHPKGAGAVERRKLVRQLADPLDYKKTKWFSKTG